MYKRTLKKLSVMISFNQKWANRVQNIYKNLVSKKINNIILVSSTKFQIVLLCSFTELLRVIDPPKDVHSDAFQINHSVTPACTIKHVMPACYMIAADDSSSS